MSMQQEVKASQPKVTFIKLWGMAPYYPKLAFSLCFLFLAFSLPLLNKC